MIDALIGGKVFGQTAQRTSKSGKPFVTCKVRVAGADGLTLMVSVIAFDTQPCRTLLELADGDSVSISGALTPKVWIDKQGAAHPQIDVVAHQVLTPYHATKKRKAIEAVGSNPAPQHHPTPFPDHH